MAIVLNDLSITKPAFVVNMHDVIWEKSSDCYWCDKDVVLTANVI
jgi:hypothetical protein